MLIQSYGEPWIAFEDPTNDLEQIFDFRSEINNFLIWKSMQVIVE